MSNIINILDYIKEEIEEVVELNSENELEDECELEIKRASNRGVTYTNNGKLKIDLRKFAEYVVSRVDLFRLDSDDRYIKNQITRAYEKVSEVTLKKICRSIMDEVDKSYFAYVKPHILLDWIDEEIQTYRKLEINNRYILFPNGFYDIKRFSFDSNFETEAILTYQMKFSYDENADCPRWKKALKKMFPDDTEEITSVIQEMFGYTFLYGETPADTLFYLWGKGRNGKSIIANVLKALHGIENIAAVPLADLENKFKLAAVYDKRVCICPENKKEKLSSTSVLKSLTGRDAVDVEEKYKNSITSEISTKIIVNSNFYLRVDDTSDGLWERILPIPFLVTFCSQENFKKREKSKYLKVKDVNLEKKLKKELAGIFNWSIEGLMRLKSNNWVFTSSEKITELKNEMMMYCKPVSVFISQCIEQGNSNLVKGKVDSIQSSEVQTKFITWAKKKSVNVTEYKNPVYFRMVFQERLAEQGIVTNIGKKSVDYYKGIKWKE